ncbi:hypothetical protein GHT06_007808 [Daphnia sinensis]|uniref:Nuclear respiratory factor 1 NLS/DNA-binding dimerisation domain-containing protein n=1 Tax=Daphnia sinensis TaxID=1820382 RepID=A0AAD5LJV7_9CRUS|nr:hypothetical protein GHT06_007808 [Daphnia sinensis]
MESYTEDKGKQDVMVSNLPLLFADGKPISISSMSVEDLQYFIPFLLKCILGCDPSGWAKFSKFKWWPPDVPWSPIILTKKYQTLHWASKLSKLVKNCYEYNGCTYLLHFSAKLQTLSGGYKFEDNWDGTTSMYDSTNGKLLVTFQNENMIYDKGFRQQSNTSRPMLLPRLNSPTSPAKLNTGTLNPTAIEEPTAAKMVEPPINDIYLCDYCGADFSSLAAIKAHEAKCMADKALEAQSHNSFAEPETQNMDEAQFLWYLSLSRRNQTLPPPNVTPAKIRPVVRRACTLSDKRFTTIPFSSNLGQSFFKAIKLTPTASELLISRYERLCMAKPVALRLDPLTGENINQTLSSATHRFRAAVYKRKNEWAHIYSFSKADRKERLITIETGLNKRARQLLSTCQGVSVEMVRLKPEDIKRWTRPKPKHQQPLLQPWVQRSIANLPASCTISLAPIDSQQTWLRHQQTPSSSSISRPDTARNLMATKSNSLGKPQVRSPPGLLPLITGTWSMQAVQPNKANTAKNQFILPDLIPVVNRHPKNRPPDPVIIRMPSIPSPNKSAISTGNITDVVDLCSSEDEALDDSHPPVASRVSQPFVLPPGISITKVKNPPSGMSCRPLDSKSDGKALEKNNNRSRSVSQWLASAVSGPLPILRCMGQRNSTMKQEPALYDMVSPSSSADTSLPIVTPLKLGKLPAEKREQMKQSLLKIQQKEKKSPQSNAEQASPLFSAKKIQALGEVDPLQCSPLLGSSSSPNKDLSRLLSDECKEMKHKGLGDLFFSNQRQTRRKRATESEFYSCGEEDSLSDGPSKRARKLEHSPSSSLTPERNLVRDSNSYSSVMEVNLIGPDNEICDSSRASSFGSLTPDSKVPRKRSELIRLLNDECKELRRNGLEDLSLEASPNQRVTRCRTKSQPLLSGKR